MYHFRNEKEAQIGLDWINTTFVVFERHKCTLGKSKYDKPTLEFPEEQKQYTTSLDDAVKGMGDYLEGYRVGAAGL